MSEKEPTMVRNNIAYICRDRNRYVLSMSDGGTRPLITKEMALLLGMYTAMMQKKEKEEEEDE